MSNERTPSGKPRFIKLKSYSKEELFEHIENPDFLKTEQGQTFSSIRDQARTMPRDRLEIYYAWMKYRSDAYAAIIHELTGYVDYDPNDILPKEDKLLRQMQARADKGDPQAARGVLALLICGLKDNSEVPFTPYARRALWKMLHRILGGEDAREVTWSKPTAGTTKWEWHPRDFEIVVEMNYLIRHGRGNWQAAGDLVGKFFDPDTDKPLTQKTIYNVWNRRKDDPDYRMRLRVNDNDIP